MTKALSYLSSAYRFLPFKWETRRNDELSGTGDGRLFQAELADPLWTAQVLFAPALNGTADEAEALVRGLHGASEPFLLASPLFCAPKSDPTGSTLGASTVTVGSIGAGRDTMSLSGTPGGYALSVGDKVQVIDSDSPARYHFFEVLTAVTGSSSFDVFPRVPASVTAGDGVTLKYPAARVVIVPGSHQAGTVAGAVTSGGGFQVIQRR